MNMIELTQRLKSLFPPEAKDARIFVDTVLAHPQTQAVLANVERDRLAQRGALAARMASLPGEAAERQAAANKAMGAARERYRLAEAELRAANGAVMEATAIAAGLSNKVGRDLAQAERDLIDSADPRIGEMLWQLSDLHEIVRHVLDIGIRLDHHFEGSGRSATTLVHNGAEVAAACALIRELQGQCRAMQLQALPEDRITQELRDMTLSLAALLEPLGQESVIVSDEGAVVRQRVHKVARATPQAPRPAGRAAQQHGSAA